MTIKTLMRKRTTPDVLRVHDMWDLFGDNEITVQVAAEWIKTLEASYSPSKNADMTLVRSRDFLECAPDHDSKMLLAISLQATDYVDICMRHPIPLSATGTETGRFTTDKPNVTTSPVTMVDIEVIVAQHADWQGRKPPIVLLNESRPGVEVDRREVLRLYLEAARMDSSDRALRDWNVTGNVLSVPVRNGR